MTGYHLLIYCVIEMSNLWGGEKNRTHNAREGMKKEKKGGIEECTSLIIHVPIERHVFYIHIVHISYMYQVN